jgi:hypothetical protein
MFHRSDGRDTRWSFWQWWSPQAGTLFIDDHRSELTVFYAGKPLLVYVFVDHQLKPSLANFA